MFDCYVIENPQLLMHLSNLVIKNINVLLERVIL